MDIFEAIAASVASAVSTTLATTGWEEFKGMLVRVVRRSEDKELAPELEQRLITEEERWKTEALTPEYRAAIDRDWFRLLYSMFRSHPEIAKALAERFIAEQAPREAPTTLQFITANDNASVQAPTDGDITNYYGSRSQA